MFLSVIATSSSILSYNSKADILPLRIPWSHGSSEHCGVTPGGSPPPSHWVLPCVA